MDRPDFILYAQHGWADTNYQIAKLANALATPQTKVIAPDLGYLKTWLRIDPLIEQVEGNFVQIVAEYPQTPIRIIGHSMGGLIWLEVLKRHPDCWTRIESLVLVASPVGGADLARIFDPLGLGIGIARDLGKNRRDIAEEIAQKIPTLVIAGDIGHGSDRTIAIQTTKFAYSQFICLQGIHHAQLKNYPGLIPIIRNFWENPVINSPEVDDITRILIKRLHSIPGITDGHYRHFFHAQTYCQLSNNLSIRTYKNLYGVDHVFLANSAEECLYAGFVGWIHSQDLWNGLTSIAEEFRHF